MTLRASNDEARAAGGDHLLERRHAGFDPGTEPPLVVGGEADVDRRGVSMRWLGASVLTGIAGAALLGSAVYVSLEGDTTFAEAPERVAAGRKTGAEETTPNAGRKGDKLVRAQMTVSARHSFRSPMTTRAGDREVIKIRNFVRVATGLSQTAGVYASDIPPFNPLRLFAENPGERAPEPAPAEVADAEVSVLKRDLVGLSIDPGAPALSDDDAVAQIAEERRLLGEAGRPSSVPIPPQLMLSRTVRQPDSLSGALGYAAVTDSPFRSIDVLVVPENVTTWPKVENRPGEALIDERDAVIKRGETLETVLRANGATAEQVRSIQGALTARLRGAAIPEGQRMKILVAPTLRPGEGRQVVRVILFGERGVEAIAAANDRGVFVSVTPQAEEQPQRRAPTIASGEEDEEEEEGGVKLYESLYETAFKNELGRQTVEELIRIFGYDVDFQRRVAPGDSMELFYTQDEETGGQPEVLFAAFTINGETRRVYRYQGEDGSIDYFDEAGRSLKKFLVRKPIAEGQLRSGFGMRRHPILGYAKMHTGVDWSNRIGTPIIAAGNGTVTKAEWDSGYGRRVEIQHTNGYVTAYSHQSRFAPGIRPGARVRQGQVIGYVGNTGLSTGPHLHYEVIVNGHFVDPMRIRVPRGRELDGRALAEFKRQREQTDGLIEKAGSTTTLAQREQR